MLCKITMIAGSEIVRTEDPLVFGEALIFFPVRSFLYGVGLRSPGV